MRPDGYHNPRFDRSRTSNHCKLEQVQARKWVAGSTVVVIREYTVVSRAFVPKEPKLSHARRVALPRESKPYAVPKKPARRDFNSPRCFDVVKSQGGGRFVGENVVDVVRGVSMGFVWVVGRAKVSRVGGKVGRG